MGKIHVDGLVPARDHGKIIHPGTSRDARLDGVSGAKTYVLEDAGTSTTVDFRFWTKGITFGGSHQFLVAIDSVPSGFPSDLTGCIVITPTADQSAYPKEDTANFWPMETPPSGYHATQYIYIPMMVKRIVLMAMTTFTDSGSADAGETKICIVPCFSTIPADALPHLTKANGFEMTGG